MRNLLITLFTLLILTSYSQGKKNWTIMHYSAGSNSSEVDLMSNIAEMKRGKKSKDYNLITLIDRIEGFSEDSLTLDGNFTDTRLYQINHNGYERINGYQFFPDISKEHSYEANMADAATLKKFIQYCKAYYPANHYMLILRSHGNGFAMCGDAEGEKPDHLYPGELSNVLTNKESVDILGLDVCSMAGLENLYEWRPESTTFSVDYVLASAPLSGAWAYDSILNRIIDDSNENAKSEPQYFEGGQEHNLNPKTMTPLDLSKLIIEEIYDNQRWASWGLFDNSKITAVKLKVDEASKLLAMEDEKMISDIIRNTLGYYHNTSKHLETAQLTFPYVDAYHFWYQISNHEQFDRKTRDLAKKVCFSIDELVLHSYYGSGFLPESSDFIEGKSGVYQIIPQGDKLYSPTNKTFWSHCGWFHPDDKSEEENSFGHYDWCSDGAIRANDQVENFYELLDFLFDESNTSQGGVNKYKW